MANDKRFSLGSVLVCANARPASLSMTNHSPVLPSPELAKSKSSSRFAVSKVMASGGLRDAVESHAVKNHTQSGSRYGRTRAFTAYPSDQTLCRLGELFDLCGSRLRLMQ